MPTDAQKLADQATSLRAKVATPEQKQRREWLRARNDEIQRVGVRAADGVTFAKQKKGNG